MKSKSIYKQFYNKLIIATSLFIITLSFIFYEYTRNTIYEDIQKNLLKQAKQIYTGTYSHDSFKPSQTDNITIELIYN